MNHLPVQYLIGSTEKLSDAAWALNAKTDAEDETLWLPLVVHLQDTAAVMEYLLWHWLPDDYYDELELTQEKLCKIAIAAALLHDIGKATPMFQRKILAHRETLRHRLEKNGLVTEPQKGLFNEKLFHAAAGAEILRAEEINECLAAVVGAHHGKPESHRIVSFREESPMSFGWNNTEERDTLWGNTQRELLTWALNGIGIIHHEDLPKCGMAAQMALTGLVIMADWIASNTAFFPMIREDELPRKYDPKRAEFALQKLNLPAPWKVSDDWKMPYFFMSRFGFSANRMQETVKQIAAEMEKPGIMILEALMGQGKTEAALSAAEIMMNRFHLGGIAFFLPSQATSNAMFTRMTQWAQQQPESSGIAVSLVHGQAEFNESFRQLEEGSVQVGDEEQELWANDMVPESLIVHSFFRGRKTKLLANLVVGTVDQLLMAALRQKHVMLRHLGLTGKVVIIDECHAYDTYMNTYLDCALKWLGAYHVPVILLSATLPGKRRTELLHAYSGKKTPAEFKNIQEYPLLTWTSDNHHYKLAIPSEGTSRTVLVERCTEEQAIAELGNIIEYGCVGFIVNTVKRAQELWKRLKEIYPKATILMDHSRYLTPDRLQHEQDILEHVGKHSTLEQRKGVIVIGTQVLEQSLDLDFDLLITDLCPMDLLLQRIGRLHRHSRQRPTKAITPRCLVLGAQGELDAGSLAVYGAYLLLRTRGLLPNQIRLPEDISPLVQKTYDEALWEPESTPEYEDAKNQHQLFQKKQRKRASSYCMLPPSTDGFFDTIVGTMDNMQMFTDLQAQAAVRDGTAAIEVLVVQQDEDGQIKLLSKEHSRERYQLNIQPSIEESRVIAAQRLRLPSTFSQNYCIDAVIKELEEQMGEKLFEWLQSPVLQGELFLVLNSEGTAELAGKKLYYDPQFGLAEKEE